MCVPIGDQKAWQPVNVTSDKKNSSALLGRQIGGYVLSEMWWKYRIHDIISTKHFEDIRRRFFF